LLNRGNRMGRFDCNLFVLRTFLRHMYPWARLAIPFWLFASQDVYFIWLSYLLTMMGWLLQEHGRVHSIRYLRIIFFIALWDHIIIYLQMNPISFFYSKSYHIQIFTLGSNLLEYLFKQWIIKMYTQLCNRGIFLFLIT
jgi:hypothetical protein